MIRLKPLLLESKQNIINLGYPPLIVDIFYEVYGNKKAYILAKWYRDYKGGQTPHKGWFFQSHYSSNDNFTATGLIRLYNSTVSVEDYKKEMEQMGYDIDDIDIESQDPNFLSEKRATIKKELVKKFTDEVFFKYNLIIEDLISGKLKDLSPYKNLNFWDAELKYDERRIFKNISPLKTYPDGYMWINVGRRSHLMAHYMKNCGSSGLMSDDEDRTIIGLFDPHHKPHVIVTYSPNQKRISSEQGIGSSSVKEKYHEYVIDLANFLGVNLDVSKSNSKMLILKYKLQGKLDYLEKIPSIESYFDEYFKIGINNKTYYSNGYLFISEHDMNKIKDLNEKNTDLNFRYNDPEPIKVAFAYINRDMFEKMGIRYLTINDL